jgi:hypothetical protein
VRIGFYAELLATAKLLISDARRFAHAIRQREPAKVITEGTMVLDIPTLHVLTVLALVGTGRSIWAIAVGREEMVYPSWPAASAPDLKLGLLIEIR